LNKFETITLRICKEINNRFYVVPETKKHTRPELPLCFTNAKRKINYYLPKQQDYKHKIIYFVLINIKAVQFKSYAQHKRNGYIIIFILSLIYYRLFLHY